MKVAIIGAGISGLAAAYRLQQDGVDAVVLESASRAGGKIMTEREDGFLVEHGPNGFLSSRTAVLRLAQDVGLAAEMISANEDSKFRYLMGRGGLLRLPSSPLQFLTNPALSFTGRLRVIRELFVKPKQGDKDESIYEFATRRFGQQAARRLFDPMVTGIHAGNIHTLSWSACFPEVAALEQEHGSIIKGLVARSKKRAAEGAAAVKPGLTSFSGGMASLISACVRAVGEENVHCERPVERFERTESGKWRVFAQNGEALDVDQIVFTTPAPVTAQLLAEHNVTAAERLGSITYAPAVVVALGYDRKRIPDPLAGFGYLAPSEEQRDVLGVLWSSRIFAGRAPDGRMLFRAIVGGAHRPEMAGFSDEELIYRVTAELGFAFGANLRRPDFSKIVRWPVGIPQYVVGHRAKIDDARDALRPIGGLHIAGNAVVGVSVADCVGHAETLPERIREQA